MIHIDFGRLDPDPDLGGAKMTPKKKKFALTLDVLQEGL
jgi:hypothetical protein